MEPDGQQDKAEMLPLRFAQGFGSLAQHDSEGLSMTFLGKNNGTRRQQDKVSL